MWKPLALVVVIACVLGTFPAALLRVHAQLAQPAQACPCGPDYCVGDARYPTELAQKKRRLSARGFPAELVNLLDRDGKCVAAIQQGPDTFLIKRLIDGVWTTSDLNEERERYASEDLVAGRTSAYYKFNTPRALSCCGESRYDQRDDWDSMLEINKRLVLKCTVSAGAVKCTPGM